MVTIFEQSPNAISGYWQKFRSGNQEFSNNRVVISQLQSVIIYRIAVDNLERGLPIRINRYQDIVQLDGVPIQNVRELFVFR